MALMVCLCKGITDEEIVEAIENGADTFEKVMKATGAGSGPCKGGRCRSRIEDLIDVIEKNKNLAN